MTERKFRSDLTPGEEIGTYEYVLTPELVELYAVATDDRHPWYVEDSPFGGRIAHPTMVHMDFHRLEDHFLTSRPEEAGVHTEYDARYINPARVGEKITVKSRCAANLTKRGRRYITIEVETFGEDGRPITHYFDTHLVSYKREEK